MSDALRAIAERSPIATAILGGPSLGVRYANASFDGLRGAAVLLGGNDRVAELLQRVHENGEAVTEVEVEAGSDVGDEACVCWSITIWPVTNSGDQRGDLVVQIRDATADVEQRNRQRAMMSELREISERMLFAALREQELREQTQAASESKSAFLATMSHELRTPLTAIIGYEELLADGITGPVTEAQRVQLDRIKKSASHLLALIDEILTLARVEARRETVQSVEVDLSDLIERVTTIVAPLAIAKRLKLTVNTGDHEPVLRTDELKLRQILVNLLGNAVKFTEQGEVTLSTRAEENHLIFEVRDTGIGIATADREHVFDPFWQADQSPTRPKQGAGLGLSVSRNLARLMGGDLTLDAADGGSTFTVRLPVGPRGAD